MLPTSRIRRYDVAFRVCCASGSVGQGILTVIKENRSIQKETHMINVIRPFFV